MHLKSLKVFCDVVRLHSFSRAAEENDISQSGASQVVNQLEPRPGVWPIAPERMALRLKWIRAYETQARGYASCAFMETLGSGATHPEAQFVQQIHDELSRACTQLPIA